MSNLEKQGIVIGISGGGSTMEYVYRATQDGRLPKTEIIGVFSSNREAGGLKIAKGFEGLNPYNDVKFIDPNLPSYGEEIINFLSDRRQRLDLFCQYGLTPFTPGIVIDWLEENKVKGINQHGGAVNPDQWDFGGKGMSCPERFHASRIMFVQATGGDFYQYVTAQALAKEYDAGRVYNRAMVPIRDDDSVATLKARAIEYEWDVQTDTLRDFEKGRAEFLPPITNLVLPDERPLLKLVKGIACELYDAEGNKIENPNFDRLNPDNDSILTEKIRHLESLLYPIKN